MAPKSVSVREILAKSVLTKSRIPGQDYCVNPYVGCAHDCRYCYASFMKRFTGHTEPWGSFVDARVNAPEVLEQELRKTRPGSVMLSSVTDPYQPLERKYELSRRCLQALVRKGFPVDILTKSPLVLRDLDVLEGAEAVAVGLTVTTDDDRVREAFEPGAPSIPARLDALRRLREAGIPTYAFVGPLLPMNPERLAEGLCRGADRVYVDRMNYTAKTAGLYRHLGLERWLEAEIVAAVEERLVADLPAGAVTRV